MEDRQILTEKIRKAAESVEYLKKERSKLEAEVKNFIESIHQLTSAIQSELKFISMMEGLMEQPQQVKQPSAKCMVQTKEY